jgi:hypothetical protein
LLQILEIGFYQGMQMLHLGHEEMFALHRPVDNLVEAGAGGDGLLGSGVAGGELGFGRSLRGRSLGERGLDEQGLDEQSLDEQGRGAADQGERKECESGAQHFRLFHFVFLFFYL